MKRALFGAFFLALAVTSAAQAASVRDGVAAITRRDYPAAARILIPLAERGNPEAQGWLGYLFEQGFGVPQNYTAAADWYHRAAEQGNTTAQYQLGLLFNKGFGVPRNYVEAHKWLNLSAAGAPGGLHDARVRIRDAVATKMTRGEIAISNRRALEWVAHPEPPAPPPER
jgi:uncharacterized protein